MDTPIYLSTPILRSCWWRCVLICIQDCSLRNIRWPMHKIVQGAMCELVMQLAVKLTNLHNLITDISSLHSRSKIAVMYSSRQVSRLEAILRQVFKCLGSVWRLFVNVSGPPRLRLGTPLPQSRVGLGTSMSRSLTPKSLSRSCLDTLWAHREIYFHHGTI